MNWRPDMFDLVGKAFSGLVSVYQEKQILDFLADYPQVFAMVAGAVVIVAVILPIGPEWFRATKALGILIMSGGLILMVGGFIWAGSLAAVDAARTLKHPQEGAKSSQKGVSGPTSKPVQGKVPVTENGG